jgi:beta-galactosidase
MQFRAVIQKHVNYTLPDVPQPKKTIAIPPISFTSSADIFSVLPKPVVAQQPLSFEKLNQAYGYVVYRTKINNATSGMLAVKELRDYAVVFVNGKKQGVLNRMLKQDRLQIELSSGENTIDIVVENMGRVNFGPNLLKNNKGITEKVTLNGKELQGWEMYSLPMKDVSNMKYNNKPIDETPVLKKASFTLMEVGDTYFDMRKFGKGCIWINGHNLGRYWEVGPQQTVYVPAEWLKKGANEIVVFELIKPGVNEIESLNKPVLSDLDEAYRKDVLSK